MNFISGTKGTAKDIRLPSLCVDRQALAPVPRAAADLDQTEGESSYE